MAPVVATVRAMKEATGPKKVVVLHEKMRPKVPVMPIENDPPSDMPAEPVRHLSVVMAMEVVPSMARMGVTGVMAMAQAMEANMDVPMMVAKREKYRASCKRRGAGESHDQGGETD